MRNLKRALSLALAMVMVLSMMVIGAGAVNLDDFSDKDEIVNTEAVTVLTTLNVINGKDDGSYDPTGIVTRAEMAKIICVVLNGGNDPALGASSTHTYTDTVNHWAEAYIEYCTQLGIVAGKGDGTFDPNGTVTATEAAKMLLVALGYNAGFEGMVGANWAISTNVLANQNKLYGGLSIDVDAGLTRDNAAQMAYNALNCEMVAYTYALVTGADGSLTSIPRVEKKDDTLLSEKFGGVRVEGVVVENEQTSSNFEGKTRIDITNGDELAKVGHNFVTTASDGSVNTRGTFEVSTDASLLGTSVFFYVVPSVASPNNTEKAVVLGSVMDSGKNVVVSTTKNFGSDGLAGFEKDNDIEYDAAAYYVDGKTASKTDIADQETGWEVKFIDSDNDGKTEYVVQTRYSFGKITKYSTKDDGTLTIDKYTNSKNFKAEKIVGFEDVALDDYVVYNTMGGKLYVAVAETVTGTLETFKHNDARLKSNLTVDGTTYTFSESANYDGKDGKLKDPQDYTKNEYMGKEITLYLDKFGYVAAVSDIQGFTDYAYIANASSNNDATGMAGSVRVYAVLADGTEASYVIDELDNESCTGVTGEDGAGSNAVTVGNLYGYYVTSEGKIDLTTVSNAPQSGSIEFKKGNATITGVDEKVDSNTVFFYAMLEGSTIDSVETYVGKDNAPSVEMTIGGDLEMTVVDKDNDDIADAVLFVTNRVSSSNVLFLYNYVKSTGDNAIYDAVIDGELVEGITLDTKDAGLAGKPYTYTITSKGYYDVDTSKLPTTTISGFVTLVDGKSVVVGSTEVKVVSDTTIAEIDGTDTAIISGVAEKDYVTVVYNDSTDEATAIYLMERYATDNANVLGTKDASVVTDKLVTAYTDAETILKSLVYSYNTADDKAIVDDTAKATIEDYATASKAIEDNAETTLTAGDTYYIVTLSKDGESYAVTKLTVEDATIATANVAFALTDPAADESNTIAVDQSKKTVAVSVENSTASVTITADKSDAQKIVVGGDDASDVSDTYTVNTSSVASAGGTKTFTLTVSEDGHTDVVYTVTVTVAAP